LRISVDGAVDADVLAQVFTEEIFTLAIFILAWLLYGIGVTDGVFNIRKGGRWRRWW
jgi:hypothetical protein